MSNQSAIIVELKVTEGPEMGRVFSFEQQDTFILGRAEDCTCRIKDDKTFSRHHLLIEVNQSNVSLKDLGSLNGTTINGIKYGGRDKGIDPKDAESSPPIALRNGDAIKAGAYAFKLLIVAPILCVDCGHDIAPNELHEAEFINGTHLCRLCREREYKKQAKPKNDKKLEDVRMKIEQRQKAENDPAAVINELFLELLGVKQEKNEPLEINKYRNLKQIGAGGFGAVYRAERVRDGQIVAIKTMLQTRKPPEKQLRMFEREKEIALQLKHNNIISTNDGGLWNDIHFIEMEYVEGGSVYDFMNRSGGKLNLNEALPIMMDVLEGMAYAHKVEIEMDTAKGMKKIQGIIHRDMKPPNILIAYENGKQIAKVSDFGLAKAFSAAGLTQNSITVAGSFCGSPPYMAREHIINYRYIKPTTDVFETAATFFHMITGQTVWPITRGQDYMKVILESTPLRIKDCNPALPSKLCKVFDCALEINPDNRFRDCKEFLNECKKVF